MSDKRLVMIGIKRKGCRKFSVQTDDTKRYNLNTNKKRPLQPEEATRQGEYIGKRRGIKSNANIQRQPV
jgi:hypothetical protein